MNRRFSVNTTGFAVPQSFITKGKQRLKQHIDTVYLNNGDEFEVELFNPTKNKVLAKIELNGNSIGAGIILRPGERVFLERYIDDAKKFLFETYVVNGNNQEVQQAIANNGDVVIKFHDEVNQVNYSSSSTAWTNNQYYGNLFTTDGNFFTRLPIGSVTNTGFSLTSGINSTANYFYNQNSHDGIPCMDSLDENNVSYTKSPTSPLRHVETGRVEKGSESKQTFTYDNAQFNNWASTTNCWKIKPQSTKPVVKEELVTYCTECGAKRKKDTHKFCPHCGTKF